jgi:hypothetical protein
MERETGIEPRTIRTAKPPLGRFSPFYGQYGQYEISRAPPRESCRGGVLGRGEKLERETGIEPATTGLGSRCSTIELLPLC